jgi:hypothetical protein
VHIIPRKANDLKSNDSIYKELENHDKGEVAWRDEEEMIHECQSIKKHIRENFFFKIKPVGSIPESILETIKPPPRRLPFTNKPKKPKKPTKM